MTQSITAVYESGVLRPLTPLDLPEHSHVRITVESASSEVPLPPQRIRARKALVSAGLVIPAIKQIDTPSCVPDAGKREKLARLFSGKPQLSDIIISERDGR